MNSLEHQAGTLPPADATDAHDRRLALAGSMVFAACGFAAAWSVSRSLAPYFVPALLVPMLLAATPLAARRSFLVRAMVVGLVTLMLITIGMTATMTSRLRHGPVGYLNGTTVHYIHDGAVHTEEAMRWLRRGVNPYGADYRDTAYGAYTDSLSQDLRPNPPWFHHVYPPFHLLVSLPFQAALERLTGWYDQRVVYLVAELVALGFLLLIAHGREWRLFIATLFVLNPFWFQYFLIGFNDAFVFALLAAAVWQLTRRRFVAASVWYGLAFAAKQSVWPLAPFFFAYVWWQRPGRRQCWRAVAAFVIVLGLTFGPFAIWDFQALVNDLWRFPTGALVTSYPISGVGLSALLLHVGVIADRYDYFPFILPQVLVGAPLLLLLFVKLRQRPTVARLLWTSTLFTFVVWFLSRYFNMNYVAYFSMLGILWLAVTGPPRFTVAHRTPV